MARRTMFKINTSAGRRNRHAAFDALFSFERRSSRAACSTSRWSHVPSASSRPCWHELKPRHPRPWPSSCAWWWPGEDHIRILHSTNGDFRASIWDMFSRPEWPRPRRRVRRVRSVHVYYTSPRTAYISVYSVRTWSTETSASPSPRSSQSCVLTKPVHVFDGNPLRGQSRICRGRG